MREPAKKPCFSCPYRTDSPSGLWHSDHYEKLPEYDKPTGEQPIEVFGCHQANGRLCSGWVACHDMDENLALRISVSSGFMSEDAFHRTLEYSTDVPLFPTGQAACDHGMRDIDNPGERTKEFAEKITKKQLKRLKNLEK